MRTSSDINNYFSGSTTAIITGSGTANFARRHSKGNRSVVGGRPLRGDSSIGKRSNTPSLACHCPSRSLAWCCGVSVASPRALLQSRKSQAAMEFLMTYGWGILVVLAAIGALAYFGVLSPSRFLPESCTLPSTSGLACLDFTLHPSSANLFMVNGGGRDLVINNVTIGDCSSAFGSNFADGSSYLFNLTGCSFGSIGEKVKKPIVVSYTDVTSGFSKSAEGSITASLS